MYVKVEGTYSRKKINFAQFKILKCQFKKQKWQEKDKKKNAKNSKNNFFLENIIFNNPTQKKELHKIS